jgi:dihydrofolate reductase
MSLDGFIDADRINVDFMDFVTSATFQEAVEKTGAVIMGRRVYDMADPFMWADDDYEYQTPIFVLTHNPPEKFPEGNGKLRFIFVSDVESAATQAREAAGGKNVQIIGGASTIQQCLDAGLIDELKLDVMAVLLGDGLRLLENIDADKITLERTKVEEITAARTSITFKVSKAN